MSNIDRVVNAALELNASVRSDHLEQIMAPEHFAREYCTVHIDCGRQTGKTDFILNTAGENDLIIVHNQESVRMYKSFGHKDVLTVDRLDPVLRGRSRFAKVWVDEPSFSIGNRTNLSLLYYWTASLSRHGAVPTYIFLGS